jgi:hypothetical protein
MNSILLEVMAMEVQPKILRIASLLSEGASFAISVRLRSWEMSSIVVLAESTLDTTINDFIHVLKKFNFKNIYVYK